MIFSIRFTRILTLAALFFVLPLNAFIKESKETKVQKLMYINISGLQKINLSESFRELDFRDLNHITAHLNIKSLDGKSRFYIEKDGVKFSYPITAPSKIKKIKIPLPKKNGTLEGISIVFKGKFYLEKLSLSYKKK